jgi:hypothetical protein
LVVLLVDQILVHHLTPVTRLLELPAIPMLHPNFYEAAL